MVRERHRAGSRRLTRAHGMWACHTWTWTWTGTRTGTGASEVRRYLDTWNQCDRPQRAALQQARRVLGRSRWQLWVWTAISWCPPNNPLLSLHERLRISPYHLLISDCEAVCHPLQLQFVAPSRILVETGHFNDEAVRRDIDQICIVGVVPG